MRLAQPQQKSSLETGEELLSVELFIVRSCILIGQFFHGVIVCKNRVPVSRS